MNSTIKTRENSVATGIYEWIIETAVFAIIAVVICNLFYFRVAEVFGSSMHPTLESGDRLIVSQFNYKPERGDVVIVVVPEYKPLVKRIIAVEADVIDIDFEQGIVYVNGIPQDEPYIAQPTHRSEDVSFPQRVPQGFVFVMGDNRNNSTDSRSSTVGMVDERTILGKAVLRMLPVDAFGVVQ